MPVCSLRRFWRQLAGAVHPADAPIFDSYPDHTFNLSFPPPAFVGDIDSAPIVVLMANGGYKQGQTEAEFPDQESVDLKRPGTAGYERYALIEEGMTVREFMENRRVLPVNPPTRRDIIYNIVPRRGQVTPNLELSGPGTSKAIAARIARQSRIGK